MKYILPAILILISLGTFFVFTNPHYQNVKDYQAKIAEYNDALNNEAKLERDRDTLSSKFHSFPLDAQDRLVKMLPDNADNIRLVIDIQKIAVANGVTVVSTQFDSINATSTSSVDAKNPKDYGVFDLGFSITGTYKNFLSFLKAMESNLRLNDIVSMAFSSGDAKDTYTFSIKLKTYWLKAI